MNNKYNLNTETDNNKLNTYLQSIHNIKINVPSSNPSYKPIIYDEDDDNVMETIYKKSKYPTHHPKKDVSTTIRPSEEIDPFFSMISSETSSESPTPVLTTGGSTKPFTNLFPITQPVIIVTDDFHVTPIIVINTNNKQHNNKTTN